VEKRNDGFHNLETVFYPLPFTDILEVITDPGHQPGQATEPKLTTSGLNIDTSAGNNICLKAWNLLQKNFSQLTPVKLHLHKNVPMGAGLGGGSADGAFTLKMLNTIFDLNMPQTRLADYALELGSDCPFFIYNQPMFASGRGEILEAVDVDLSGYSFLVVDPGLHISTAQAFSQIRTSAAPVHLKNAITLPVETWKENIKNDFEESAYFLHPQLKDIKPWLYNHGAVYASMTGSGSCFYGIFEKDKLPLDTRPGWQFIHLP